MQRLVALGAPARMTIRQKLGQVPWSLALLVSMIAGIGFAMLYSAANGSADPWMDRQVIRYCFGFALMMAIATIDLQRLVKAAYTLYVLTFMLLIYVEVAGEIGMGAQRWIDLKFFQLQPSEIMKIALVLALARYFRGISHEDMARPLILIVPTILILAPVALVLVQPDLGTAFMLTLVGAMMFVAAGVRWWKFALVAIIGLAGAISAWRSDLLHDYQRRRILTFLDPETDALGAGYHITQSKIAFGSGGIFGKGFLNGTQSHLDFLPERQTDFIFTMLAEEWGLIGGLVVPLPLISYGGTAMMTVMVGFGLIMSVFVHRDMRITKLTTGEEG